MTIKSYWRVYLNAKSEESATRVMKKVVSALDTSIYDTKIDPYHKGGHVCTFYTLNGSGSRDGSVIDIIKAGQRVARGWQLLGAIDHEPSGVSNESSISGVDMVTWAIREPTT